MKLCIHPLAALQVSDHYTRSKYFTKKIPFKCGILYGTSNETQIEIYSTIEVAFYDTLPLKLNAEVFSDLNTVHKLNYPKETPLGWYSIDELSDSHIETIQNIFSNRFEVLVRAFYNKDENLIDYFLCDSDKWISSPYEYVSELAERVAIAQLQSGSSGSQVSYTHDAFLALDKHLELIQNYLKDVSEKKRPFDCTLVRQCSDIASWWKHQSDEDVKDEREAEVALLVTTLTERILEMKKK